MIAEIRGCEIEITNCVSPWRFLDNTTHIKITGFAKKIFFIKPSTIVHDCKRNTTWGKCKAIR